jgi:hypothetical protein
MTNERKIEVLKKAIKHLKQEEGKENGQRN